MILCTVRLMITAAFLSVPAWGFDSQMGDVVASARESQSRTLTSIVSDPVIRGLATSMPDPIYPKESLEKGVSGVAVAEVLIGTHGKVEHVQVLEAPDAHIRKAVADAVTRSTFGPLTAGPDSTERRRIQGKLIFYFRIVGGTGRILSASEVSGASHQGKEARSAAPAVTGAPPPIRPPSVPSSEAREIDELELTRMLVVSSPLILDIRDRTAYAVAHRGNSTNIPLDELSVRGAAELSTLRSVVIDCSYETVSRCRLARRVLLQKGLTDVAILVK